MIVDNLILRHPKRYVVSPERKIEIPWPQEKNRTTEKNKKEAAPAKEKKEYEVDTLRIDVDEETWRPKLLSVPFPGTVIDELRNKYGRFRIRHDDAWVEHWRNRNEEAKETEERKKAAMMTPKEEWAVLKKREAEQREEPVLSEEVLERIGRVMAKNKKSHVEDTSQQ